jgi:ankyrin repeat protein
MTPLMIAADYQKWSIVKLLLRSGANAKLLTTYGNNALHNAIRQDASDDIIKALISAGADSQAKNHMGKTPAKIFWEKFSPREQFDKTLANRNLTVAQVNAATKQKLEANLDLSQCTALYWASKESSIEVVKAILDKGVDINQISGYRNYCTALKVAVQERRWAVVELLLQKGATPKLSDMDEDGWDELHFAAYHSAPSDIIRTLIYAGANPHDKDYRGKSPADLARGHGNKSLGSYIEHFTMAPTKSANLMI